MYHNDRQYTQMRLQNTVVRDINLKGLVQIVDIFRGEKGGFNAEVVSFKKNTESYLLPLEDLDLASPPLGNVSYRGNTYYVARVPKRNDWRQGLRSDNLSCVVRGKMYKYVLPSLSYLEAPVYNTYPSYADSVDNGLAFSREFSLDDGGELWYKCREKVGRDVGGTPVLKEKYEWLKEALEDALGK